MEVLKLSHGKLMDCMSGLPWEPVTDVLYGFSSLTTLPHQLNPPSFHPRPQTSAEQS